MSRSIDTSQRFAQHSFLGPFDAPWPTLGQPNELDLEGSFQRMGERLRAVPLRAVLHFEIREVLQSQSWSLQLGPDGPRVYGERLEDPDLEIMTDADTWMQIASGSLSPLAAFGGGRMRVIGDLQVARRIASRMAAAEER